MIYWGVVEVDNDDVFWIQVYKFIFVLVVL